jgi:hypothetical protein
LSNSLSINKADTLKLVSNKRFISSYLRNISFVVCINIKISCVTIDRL